jgi:hypothetical protein
MTDDRNYYLETLGRIEPEIAQIDSDTFHASAAISLKRIADSTEQIAKVMEKMNQVLDPVIAKLKEEGSIPS